jgi:Undecaprenyl-phosphate glucose phosphotransferase
LDHAKDLTQTSAHASKDDRKSIGPQSANVRLGASRELWRPCISVSAADRIAGPPNGWENAVAYSSLHKLFPASAQSNLDGWFATSSLQGFRIRFGIGEFLLVSAAAYLGSATYHRMVLLQWPDPQQYAPAALLLGAMVSGVTLALGGFNGIERTPLHRFMCNGVSAITVAFALFVSLMFLFKVADAYSRGTFLFQLVCILAGVLALRLAAHSRLQAGISAGWIEARRVVLIGDREHCSEYSLRLRMTGIRTVRTFGFPARHESDIDLASPSAGGSAYIRQCIRECRSRNPDDIIVLADEKHLRGTRALTLALSELPADIHVVPVEADDLIGAARIVEFGKVVTLQVARRPLSQAERFIKRSFDVVGATIGLILLAPLLVVVAIMIKLDSPGPVLFQQTRHGFNNKPIRVLKFRSMRVMEDGSSFKQATKGDERVTRLGRILRRTNIDELPQLCNVLFGDMSLVGPRPHATAHNEMFEQLIWPFYRRHNVKPGITGWAQVHGFRGETDTLEKMRRRVECDLYYVDNWSLLLDFKIIIMTLFSLAAYSNAY